VRAGLHAKYSNRVLDKEVTLSYDILTLFGHCSDTVVTLPIHCRDTTTVTLWQGLFVARHDTTVTPLWHHCNTTTTPL
jgi:hypothetical protein